MSRVDLPLAAGLWLLQGERGSAPQQQLEVAERLPLARKLSEAEVDMDLRMVCVFGEGAGDWAGGSLVVRLDFSAANISIRFDIWRLCVYGFAFYFLEYGSSYII